MRAKGEGELVSDDVPARYELEWSRWENWATAHGYPPLPAEAAHLAEYAVRLLVLGASPPSVGMVLTSIRWRHRMMNIDQPPADDRMQVIRERPDPDTRTARDAADLIAANSKRKSYRVGKGVRVERPARTRKRAMIDAIIITLGWETLATAGEIAKLEWVNVDLDGRRLRYGDSEPWTPISGALADRLVLLKEVRGDAAGVVGLSRSSIRRRVREADAHAGLGAGWTLRRVRAAAIRAITAGGASVADLNRGGLTTADPSSSPWSVTAADRRVMEAHVQDSPLSPRSSDGLEP